MVRFRDEGVGSRSRELAYLGELGSCGGGRRPAGKASYAGHVLSEASYRERCLCPSGLGAGRGADIFNFYMLSCL